MTDILAQQYDKESEIYINSTDDGHTTIEMAFRFIKNEFPPKISPKQRLYESTKTAGLAKPVYDVVGSIVQNITHLQLSV